MTTIRRERTRSPAGRTVPELTQEWEDRAERLRRETREGRPLRRLSGKQADSASSAHLADGTGEEKGDFDGQ